MYENQGTRPHCPPCRCPCVRLHYNLAKAIRDRRSVVEIGRWKFISFEFPYSIRWSFNWVRRNVDYERINTCFHFSTIHFPENTHWMGTLIKNLIFKNFIPLLYFLSNPWYPWYTKVAYSFFFYIPFTMILSFSGAISTKIAMMQKERKAKRGEPYN